jgi:glutamate/tyrosine decarboxylase-like PLP-dependent enzyme
VWLALQQAGRDGYVQTISEDIRLAGELFRLIAQTPGLEALTQSLSITTFRFVPSDMKAGGEDVEKYLDQLNNELLTRLQNSGEVYLSNAIVRGRFALRACIVNFRTTQADIEALPPLIVRIGEKADGELRPAALRR